jgi:outer membrane receptor protein involved in Fe transport
LFPLPGVRVANLSGGLQKTIQASAGIEADVTPRWTASLIGFRHWNRNTSDFFGALTTPNFIPEVLTRTDGTTTGAELSARGRIGKEIGAYLAYTLSRSTRIHEGRTFVSSFDRTHVGTAMATYEAGRSWRVGGRLTVVSGVPRNDPAKVGTADESERVTPYFRIDARAEKRWLWDGAIPVALYFEVMNLTANREIILSDCEESGCLKADKVGPVIVPNIGAELFF